MNLLETFSVALSALWANKLRSALTMLGLIIGVGSVIAIIAIGRGTQKAVAAELDALNGGVFQLMATPGWSEDGQPTARLRMFRDDDIALLKEALPEIDLIDPQVGMSGRITFGREVEWWDWIRGAGADTAALMNIQLSAGRWFTEEEIARGDRVMVLSASRVEYILGEGVNPLGIELMVNGYPFQIIGVIAPNTGMLSQLLGGQGGDFYVPRSYITRVTGQNSYDHLTVRVRDGYDPVEVKDLAVRVMERLYPGTGYEAYIWTDFMGEFNQVISIVTGVMAAIAGISLVVGGVGIMNIMMVSVTERTREIGLRKAIGARRRDILMQFLVEALTLCLIGGGIGIVLAAGPVTIAARYLETPLSLDLYAIALALGFSAAVGLIFGVYPAVKAARMDPIEALRYE
ncbi:ABC transporter permease [Symbiobacterium thermophilum]|uniref:ABC transporter permease protein n=3 Tax=Symbiobacterium thermophilum TaxID=2734 RepID=Q67NF0_SYMTH|nr:ABC transporter permease [Symbiobacterium thermophilum]BAD40793.1 ABC transporter permease protein [Symbiobacterium thermophilum IAM 14863]